MLRDARGAEGVAQRTVSAVVRSREKAVPVVALHVLRHGVQRQRLLPCLDTHSARTHVARAGHATLGQHVVVGPCFSSGRVWNLPGGVWLAPVCMTSAPHHG